MSMGKAPPGSSPEMPTDGMINRREQTMAKFSIVLFGIDSYTKNQVLLAYRLDAKTVEAALREARMRTMTFYPRFKETEKPDVEVVKK